MRTLAPFFPISYSSRFARRRRLALLEKEKKELAKREEKMEKEIEVVEKVASHAHAVSGVIATSKGSTSDAKRFARKKWLVAGKAVKAAMRVATKRRLSELVAKGTGSGMVLGPAGGRGISGAMVDGSAPAWVAEKLDSIERTLAVLSKSGQGGGATTASSTNSYQDPRDVLLLPPVSNQLEEKSDVSTVEHIRMEFAANILKIVGMDGSLVVKIAANLPRSNYKNNAFRNSYFYDHDSSTIWLHCERFGATGDLTLALVHALSHVKVNPMDLSNDESVAFTSEFFRNLRLVTTDLASGGGGRGGFVKQESVINVDFSMKDLTNVGTGGAAEKNDFFSEAQMVERMRQYAAVAGGLGEGGGAGGRLDRMINKWNDGLGGNSGEGAKLRTQTEDLALSDDE